MARAAVGKGPGHRGTPWQAAVRSGRLPGASVHSTAVLVSTVLRQVARDYNEATDLRLLSIEPARSRLLGFSPAIVAPSCARTKSDLSFAGDSQHAEAKAGPTGA
jgi:hypothetical protein